jgi:hypothetical protein
MTWGPVLTLCLLCGLVLPATAAAKETPTNFRFEATAPVLVAGGSAHGAGILTAPFEAGVPHVGRGTVRVEWIRRSFITCGPPPCLNSTEGSLSVQVVARGGTLVLLGTAGPFFAPSGSLLPPESAVMTGTWVVTEATGRFAGYTGAGTWSISPATFVPPPQPFGTTTVTLVGHLGKR